MGDIDNEFKRIFTAFNKVDKDKNDYTVSFKVNNTNFNIDIPKNSKEETINQKVNEKNNDIVNALGDTIKNDQNKKGELLKKLKTRIRDLVKPDNPRNNDPINKNNDKDAKDKEKREKQIVGSELSNPCLVDKISTPEGFAKYFKLIPADRVEPVLIGLKEKLVFAKNRDITWLSILAPYSKKADDTEINKAGKKISIESIEDTNEAQKLELAKFIGQYIESVDFKDNNIRAKYGFVVNNDENSDINGTAAGVRDKLEKRENFNESVLREYSKILDRLETSITTYTKEIQECDNKLKFYSEKRKNAEEYKIKAFKEKEKIDRIIRDEPVVPTNLPPLQKALIKNPNITAACAAQPPIWWNLNLKRVVEIKMKLKNCNKMMDVQSYQNELANILPCFYSYLQTRNLQSENNLRVVGKDGQFNPYHDIKESIEEAAMIYAKNVFEDKIVSDPKNGLYGYVFTNGINIRDLAGKQVEGYHVIDALVKWYNGFYDAWIKALHDQKRITEGNFPIKFANVGQFMVKCNKTQPEKNSEKMAELNAKIKNNERPNEDLVNQIIELENLDEKNIPTYKPISARSQNISDHYTHSKKPVDVSSITGGTNTQTTFDGDETYNYGSFSDTSSFPDITFTESSYSHRPRHSVPDTSLSESIYLRRPKIQPINI
jgi:hypothetical protein